MVLPSVNEYIYDDTKFHADSALHFFTVMKFVIRKFGLIFGVMWTSIAGVKWTGPYNPAAAEDIT
jgi:hypothetical protein